MRNRGGIGSCEQERSVEDGDEEDDGGGGGETATNAVGDGAALDAALGAALIGGGEGELRVCA